MDDGRRETGWMRPSVLHLPLDPTRVRPEPWFVGNGRGLMILVLSLCAVLLVARGITIIWMAQAAWEWISRPSRPSSVVAPAPATPPLRTRPPAPFDVASRPRTSAVGSPGRFFDSDSYPLDALRRNEHGRVVARLAIDAQGRATGCTVLTSSRSASLDRATCAIAVARTRYRPARDDRGLAVPSRYDLKVRWALED